MHPLISELKQDHSAIMAALDAVSRWGIASKEGVERLVATKQLLLAHLAKEDLRLYPALKSNAAKQPELQQVLAQFAVEMEEVSKTVLAFYDKYSAGGSGLDFARDFGRVAGRLKARIQREEAMLYKVFESLPR